VTIDAATLLLFFCVQTAREEFTGCMRHPQRQMMPELYAEGGKETLRCKSELVTSVAACAAAATPTVR
jgi:hypothetical protein